MEPTIWGPPAWKFLHTITFQYPEYPTDKDKKEYFIFFNSLRNVLPCPNCREHYSNNFQKYPIRLESRNDLIEWLIDIHNEVNEMTQKRKYSYEEVYEIYNEIFEGNTGGSNNGTGKTSQTITIICILLMISFIGYYYYTNYYLKKE